MSVMSRLTCHRALRCALAWLIGAACGLASASQWSLPDGAGAHPDYRGAVPPKSSVLFSTRFTRPESAPVAKSFGATRIEWVYTDDQNFVDALRQVTPWFGGAINATGPLPNQAGYARDFDGEIIVAPWMRGFGGQWYSVAAPETVDEMLKRARGVMALGARSLQVDDPLYQLQAVLFHGGDFSESALAGFSHFLEAYPDQDRLQAIGLMGFKGDYREYLRQRHHIRDAKDYKNRFRGLPSTPLWFEYHRSTVTDFIGKLKSTVRSAKPPLSLSMNLTSFTEPDAQHRMFFLSRFIDYAMSETYINDPVELASQVATMRALGIGFAPSPMPRSVPETRLAVATLYAMGTTPLVPWDTYIGNDDSGKAKRYFGKPEEYGDLYAFAAARSEELNEHEPAVEIGIVVPVHAYRSKQTKELIARLQSRQIPYAFVALDGDHKPDDKLGKFRLLVTLNPDSDFSREELAMLERSGVQRIGIDGLQNDLLDKMQPFVLAPDAEAVNLYPTARPGRSDELLVHVIDARQAAPAERPADCKRRLGVRKSVLGGARVMAATWFSGQQQSKPAVTETDHEFAVTITTCPLWGVLRLSLQR